MADDSDILLNYYVEQWTQARHVEDQRVTVTNIVMLIASVIVGFIVEKGLNKDMLPLTILLTVLGIYGAIASEKLYERFQFFVNRGGRLSRRIDELHPNCKLVEINSEFEIQHKKEYPKLSRIRLHVLWFSLHLAIAIGGFILSIIVLV